MAAESSYPNDLADCPALIAEQHRELAMRDRLIAQQVSLLEEQKAELAKVSAERDQALQLLFRKKMERYLDDPQQFVKDVGDDPDVVDAAEGIADAALESVGGYERRKQTPKKQRNEQLPAHLERYEVKLPVPAR
jgi:hypothetical protein